MAEIKPIETIYNGCRFRSRLEARWAVFFDALNVKWEYEPEGFELENGVRYLPDFLLHGVDHVGKNKKLYVEVKGTITDDDCRKFIYFRKTSNPLIVVGNILKGDTFSDLMDCAMREKAERDDIWFNTLHWDRHDTEVMFYSDELSCAILGFNCNGRVEVFSSKAEDYRCNVDRTVNAYKKASMARFEKFGNDKPTTKQQYASNRADTLESITEEQRNKLRSRKTWVSIPHSWGAFFKQVDADTVKRMILQILDYSQTGKEPDFINDDEKRIFGAFLKPVLDKDFDDYCYKQNKA